MTRKHINRNATCRPARRPVTAAAVAILLTFAAGLAAAEAPGSPPLTLQADHAELDNRTGISVYTGNVQLDRADMHITGDRMEVYTNKNRELKKVIVTGNPATYRGTRPGDKQVVHAKAPRMEYHADPPERIRLLQGGELWRGQDRFKGQTILYTLADEKVKADSGNGNRIHVTLFPEKDKGKGGQ
ncbi:MAG TPA: lipopolysaccharide transport periplasmic protein LptA [Gammaproteobacteria bacterium]|nr:lipopolysaccharide transport periplasmic protein LptA [Gammaproteobacteria bacterium]